MRGASCRIEEVARKGVDVEALSKLDPIYTAVLPRESFYRRRRKREQTGAV